MKKLLQTLYPFLIAIAVLMFAIPAFAGANLVKLPGAPADYSSHLNWYHYPVMGEQSAKGADYVNLKFSAEPGKTFNPMSSGSLPDSWDHYKVGLGKNPADQQSFGHILVASPLSDECGIEFANVLWPRGKTLGFWFPVKVDGRGSWLHPASTMWVSWYTNAFHENGTDVWYYFKRLADGTIVPLGHAKEAVPPGAKPSCE